MTPVDAPRPAPRYLAAFLSVTHRYFARPAVPVTVDPGPVRS
jgi:hypothetical protein